MADFDITSPDGRKYRVSAPEGATQDQVLAYAQEQFAKMPKAAPQSAPLPANAGAANLLTTIAGMPADTGEKLVNLGLAGAGTVATAAGRPDLAPDLLHGSVGTSEHLQGLLRKTGQPGLSPDNPNPKDPIGTAQYEFVSRGGVLPGGAVPAAASMVGEAIGGPKWGAVASMVPSAATMAYNELRAPKLAADKAAHVERDKTLERAQEEGYKVIPSQVNPSPANTALESLGGKAAVKQAAELDNQRVTDQIARREIGLPPNTPLNMQTIEARRTELSKPYAELAAVSPNADYLLRELRDARQKATAYWKEYEVQKTVSSLEQYHALNKKAQALDVKLQAEAMKAGKPELVPAMREARQAIAKTWDVERALNLGDGTVDAKALGRLYDHGAPLSGGLETIAKFSLGPGKQVTREAASVPTPNVSKLNWTMAPFLGAGGAAVAGPVGAAMGAAAPFVLPPAARSVLLNKQFQDYFARPNYEPALLPENNIQTAGRLAALLQRNQ